MEPTVPLKISSVEFLLQAASHRMPDGMSAQQALAYVGKIETIKKEAQDYLAEQQKQAQPKAEQQPVAAQPSPEALAAAKAKTNKPQGGK